MPPREAGRARTGCSRAAASERRDPDEALQRELAEETGLIEDGDELPVEGPVAIVESISPERSLWSKHVVHIVFAGDLDGSLADVVSQDEAVRGHRLFELDELEGSRCTRRSAASCGASSRATPASTSGALWAP